MTTPRIYFADLAAYNAGKIHGIWVDLDIYPDTESMMGEIEKMLKASPVADAEEWAIHDYDGFGPVRLGEYDQLEKLEKLAELINEHGDMVLAWISNYHLEYLDTFDVEQFKGIYESREEWAWDAVSELQDALRVIQDTNAYGHAVRIDIADVITEAESGNTSFVDYAGKVYVFEY